MQTSRSRQSLDGRNPRPPTPRSQPSAAAMLSSSAETPGGASSYAPDMQTSRSKQRLECRNPRAPTPRRLSLDGTNARPPTPRSQPCSPSAANVSIKVACRVRPSAASSVVTVDGDSVLVQNPGCSQDQLDPYTFDHAFDQKSTQGEIYQKVVEPVVQGVMSGINGTVFCYGQTGSGKTYTMEGDDKDPGLLPRLGKSIFGGSHIVPEKVAVCFVEIYMEKLQDLLEPSNKVEVRETMTGSVYLANASEIVVSSPSELLSCVKAGQRNRSVASTKMNEHSSRSHSVFSVSVKTCDVSGLPLQGVLHFVDLAGSESQGRTGAVGQTLEQSRYINQSLLGLGRVVGALGAGQLHVPYRDSKLTRILQDSLGGSAKTSIIVNISPEAINAYETMSSLRFGQGASLVKNAPRVNLVELGVTDLWKLLNERDAEVARLRARLAAIERITSPPKLSISIGTPEKTKPELWGSQELEDETRQLFISPAEDTDQAAQSWSWMRCLVVIMIAVGAYVTNPGQNKEDFKQFLELQGMFPVVHRMAEAFGLVQIDLQDLGLAAFGRESSRYFVGIFEQWIELPGGWSADRDVDVIVFAFLAFFILSLISPLTMVRNCSVSWANLREGRVWSIVTGQLSHARMEHLLMNIVFLYAVGPQAHAVVGRRRFMALFFIGGACAIVGSMMLRAVLPWSRAAVGCPGACSPLYVLLSYLHFTGICGVGTRWLGYDLCWAELALIQLILSAASGLDIMAHCLGALAGWAASEWQLLDLIPLTEVQAAPEWRLMELVSSH